MPPPLLPLRPPASFASADDISKELLQLYEGGRGVHLDKTGPQCGPKGQAPMHVNAGACVNARARACVTQGGGLAWTRQRGF